MNAKKIVAFNSFAQVLGKISTVLSTLFITYLITNTLGQVSYGEFTIIMAYSALFYLATDFGLNAVFTQRVSKDESLLPSYFFNLVSLRIGISLALVFIGSAFLAFSPYSNAIKVGILISLLTIITQGLFTTANAIFQYKYTYSYSAISDIIGSIINLVVVYVLVSLNWGVNFIVLSYVLSGLIRVLISFGFIRALLGRLSLEINTNTWKLLFLSALPLGITAIFSQVNGYADKLILSFVPFDPSLQVSNVVAVGWYGLAYKIFEVLLVFPTFVINAAFPMMVKSHEESKEKLKHMFLFLFGSLLGVSLMAALIGYFVAPYLIGFFEKEEQSFRGSVQVLRILLMGLPIFYMSALTMWTTVSLGRQKFLILVYALAASLNVILNIFFDPMYGIMAAASITLVTELVILAMTGYVVYTALFRSHPVTKESHSNESTI